MASSKPFDVVVLGATGFTGRQVVRALRRRSGSLRWTVAGRDAGRLAELGAPGQPIVVDLGHADDTTRSLESMAAQASVVVNLAGPYARSGEEVIAACITHGAHYLDMSAETFWIREMVARHHVAAEQAGVRVIPCAGYESMPFDLAVHWAASRVSEIERSPCRELKIIARFTGLRPRRTSDAFSGGTAATLRTLLELDSSDSVRNPACLLPPETSVAEAGAVARRNAVNFVPRYDEDAKAVVAPTLPAPFVNPPVILRGVALAHDATRFAHDFCYREATHMGSLVPRFEFLPEAATLPMQWAAAASLAAPLANLSAAIAGPLQFQRQALTRVVEWLAPPSGIGPREELLDEMGFRLDVFARASNGGLWRGNVEGNGHPGYRAAAEMIAVAAVGLADGTLGRSGRAGVVTPATGLGLEAVDAMAAAGVRFIEDGPIR